MKRIKTIQINTTFILVAVFIFLCIIIKLVWVGTGNVTVKGKELNEFYRVSKSWIGHPTFWRLS